MRASVSRGFVWLASLGEPGATLALSSDESHYLQHVCRARLGDHVTATDGRGAVATLRLTSLRPVFAEVESLEHRERGRRAWVICGAPEGERADWLIEKLAELGIERFQPIDCARARWRRSAARAERWRRLAVAGLRQSQRAFLLEVTDPLPLEQALSRLEEPAERWLADAEGETEAEPGVRPGTLCVAIIGPSPGLERYESETLKAAGFRSIRLSDARLRTETSALAWAARWASRVG